MNGLVLANSLTQVMWGFLWAVLFGNLIIAVIEGGLIASVFRVNAFRAVGLMVVANLASAWAARFVFGLGEEPTPLVEWLFQEPLYQVQVIVWVCIAVGVAMTLALEWPFVWLALGGTRDRLVRSLKALLLVHAVSITCLCGWFWPPSSNTLGRDVRVVRDLKVDPALLQGWVYYVHRRSGDVHRIRLDGSRDELVMRAGADPHRAIMWVGIDVPPKRIHPTTTCNSYRTKENCENRRSHDLTPQRTFGHSWDLASTKRNPATLAHPGQLGLEWRRQTCALTRNDHGWRMRVAMADWPCVSRSRRGELKSPSTHPSTPGALTASPRCPAIWPSSTSDCRSVCSTCARAK